MSPLPKRSASAPGKARPWVRTGSGEYSAGFGVTDSRATGAGLNGWLGSSSSIGAAPARAGNASAREATARDLRMVLLVFMTASWWLVLTMGGMLRPGARAENHARATRCVKSATVGSAGLRRRQRVDLGSHDGLRRHPERGWVVHAIGLPAGHRGRAPVGQ